MKDDIAKVRAALERGIGFEETYSSELVDPCYKEALTSLTAIEAALDDGMRLPKSPEGCWLELEETSLGWSALYNLGNNQHSEMAFSLTAHEAVLKAKAKISSTRT